MYSISREPMPAERTSVSSSSDKVMYCASLAARPSYVNSMLSDATVVHAALRVTLLFSPLKIWSWSSSTMGASIF